LVRLLFRVRSNCNFLYPRGTATYQFGNWWHPILPFLFSSIRGDRFLACGFRFIVTDRQVLLRESWFKSVDCVVIEIRSIEAIESRSYNARYGSVYIRCVSSDQLYARNDGPQISTDQTQPAKLVVKPSGLPIWLSAPFTVPFLRGFYGFKQFDVFVGLIVDPTTER